MQHLPPVELQMELSRQRSLLSSRTLQVLEAAAFKTLSQLKAALQPASSCQAQRSYLVDLAHFAALCVDVVLQLLPESGFLPQTLPV